MKVFPEPSTLTYTVFTCVHVYILFTLIIYKYYIYIYIYITSEKPVNDQSYGVLDRYGITYRRKIPTSWNVQFVVFNTSEKLNNNLVNA